MRAIVLRFTLVSLVVIGTCYVAHADENTESQVDPDSTLIKDDKNSWVLVKAHCTSCHSGRLLSQNRGTKEKWQSSIRKMQKSEGLWDLEDAEAPILEYLSTYYGQEKDSSNRRNRRAPLNQLPLEEPDNAEKTRDDDSTSTSTGTKGSEESTQ